MKSRTYTLGPGDMLHSYSPEKQHSLVALCPVGACIRGHKFSVLRLDLAGDAANRVSFSNIGSSWVDRIREATMQVLLASFKPYLGT